MWWRTTEGFPPPILSFRPLNHNNDVVCMYHYCPLWNPTWLRRSATSNGWKKRFETGIPKIRTAILKCSQHDLLSTIGTWNREANDMQPHRRYQTKMFIFMYIWFSHTFCLIDWRFHCFFVSIFVISHVDNFKTVNPVQPKFPKRISFWGSRSPYKPYPSMDESYQRVLVIKSMPMGLPNEIHTPQFLCSLRFFAVILINLQLFSKCHLLNLLRSKDFIHSLNLYQGCISLQEKNLLIAKIKITAQYILRAAINATIAFFCLSKKHKSNAN